LCPPGNTERVASRSDRQVNVGAVRDVHVNVWAASPIDARLDMVAARRYLDCEVAAATDLPDQFAVDLDVVPACAAVTICTDCTAVACVTDSAECVDPWPTTHPKRGISVCDVARALSGLQDRSRRASRFKAAETKR
jgi:hypothetical protein